MKITVAEQMQPYVIEDGWYRMKFTGSQEREGQWSPGINFSFTILDDKELAEGEGTTRGKNVSGMQWSGGVDPNGGLLMRQGSPLVSWIETLTESFGDRPPEEIGESVDLKQLVGAVVEGFVEASDPVVKKGKGGKDREMIYMNVTKIRLMKDKGSRQSTQRLSSKEEEEVPKRRRPEPEDIEDAPVRRRRPEPDYEEEVPKRRRPVEEDYNDDIDPPRRRRPEPDYEEEVPKRRRPEPDYEEEVPRRKAGKKDDFEELEETPKKRKAPVDDYLGEEFKEERPKNKRR